MGLFINSTTYASENIGIKMPRFCFNSKQDCNNKYSIGEDYALQNINTSWFIEKSGVFPKKAYKRISTDDEDLIHRGDAVFYEGHVAIIYSEKNSVGFKIIHAYGGDCTQREKNNGEV